MRRSPELSTVLLAAIVVSAALFGVCAPPALAAAANPIPIDVVNVSAQSDAGWTNTRAVDIRWATDVNAVYQCRISIDGGLTWSAWQPAANPIPWTIGSENRVWIVGAQFRFWQFNYWTGTEIVVTQPSYDTIRLDTGAPVLKGHMSAARYRTSQRPHVHYFVQDRNPVKTTAVVRRSGERVGSSRPGFYRTPWIWRSLALSANSGSTCFEAGTYQVVVRTRDKAGNAVSISRRFSVVK